MQSRDYGPKAVYATENGAAIPGVVGYEGNVLDPERQHYLETHVGAAARAALEGVPLKGYSSGSSWTLRVELGYWKRFGLVHAGYPTQKRTPKASFGWYRDFIAAHRRSGRQTAAQSR